MYQHWLQVILYFGLEFLIKNQQQHYAHTLLPTGDTFIYLTCMYLCTVRNSYT